MTNEAMNLLPRRTFLKCAALGAAGTALALRGARAAEAPAAAPLTSRRFRLFVCDWTAGKTCDPGSFEVASRAGLDGVQVDFGKPHAAGGKPLLFSEAHQERMLAASAANKVQIASLAFGVMNDIPYKSDPAAEQWAVDAIDVAKRLGQRVVLLAFFGNGDLVDDAAGVSETIRRLKKLAPHAEAAGLTYGIESWLKAPELERILDAVNSPAVKVYYDVGNMQKVGEDFGAAIRRLGRERICEIHLKDYGDLYGKGTIDFPAVRRAVDAIGYSGWLGLEGVHAPLGVEASIRYDVDYLRPLFPRPL